VLVAAVAGGLAVGYYAFHMLHVPRDPGAAAKEFTVRSGETLKEVSTSLQTQGLVRSSLAFELYARAKGDSSRIKAGRYSLSAGLSSVDILHKMVSGDVIVDSKKVTIPEGWRITQIAARLEAEGFFPQERFKAAAHMKPEYQSYWFLSRLANGESLEGYLYPDTYELSRDAGADAVVGRMLDTFQEKVGEELRKAAEEQKRTARDIVILASIVQAESPVADMPGIAGVFWNRLQNGMLLESDATVNYVLGTSKLQPTYKDVRVDSPYNTYRYRGLPPGPIGNPGADAIRASIHPAAHDFFFFLHNPDGETVYSRTLNEHLRNKRRYLD